MPTYHSHVLRFPDADPYRDEKTRWTSFVGDFVAPLMKGRPDLFWFSYYGSFARFRVYTDDYASLKKPLEELRDKLGLIDTGEEKTATIEADLGHERFHTANSASTKLVRAEAVLKCLHGICLLFIDNLTKKSGSWVLEEGTSPENPLRNNFESIAHLLANISRCQFPVQVSFRTPWMNPPIDGSVTMHL